MQDTCPICSNTLLRHLHRREISWFCPRCRQKMPNLEQQNVTLNSSCNQVVYNLNKVNNIQPTLLPTVKYQPQLVTTKQLEKNITITQVLDEQSVIVDSLVSKEQKRLEIVDFIISQINSIIINEITDDTSSATSFNGSSETPTPGFLNRRCHVLTNTELNIQDQKTIFPESEKLAVAKIEPNQIIKADFLKDSKLVLLYICQAIILRNPDLLNNQSLQELKNNYTNHNLPTEQIICWLNLIKTAVLDFIASITFEVSESLARQSLHCGQLTVASLPRYPCHPLDTEVANYFDLAIASII